MSKETQHDKHKPSAEEARELLQAVPEWLQGAHTAGVLSVAVLPDGERAISGSSDNTLKLWDIASGRCLATFEGHTDGVVSVAVLPDGERAISGSSDNTLKLWDIASGRCLATLEGHTDSVFSVAVLPDGKRAISGSSDNTLKLWDIASGKCIATFEGHTGFVVSVAVLPDGERAISGSSDNTLKVWNIATGKCLTTYGGHTHDVLSVAVLPDGERAVSGSDDDTLKLWDIATGRCLATFGGHTNPVRSVAVLPDGERAISGSDDSTLKLWDIASGRCLATFEGHTAGVFSVAVLPDGERAISGSSDNTLKLWDIASGRCLATFEGHTDEVNSVAVLPDGERAISGSDDNTLKLWDIASGRCLATFEGHTARVWSVAVLPDGERAISGSYDNTLKLWDIASGRCLATFEGHADEVNSVAVLADGERAVSGSDDGTLKLWDLASGTCIVTFKSHRSSVLSVAALPDGERAISGSADGTVKLWDIASRRCIATFEGHTDWVWSVAVLPDAERAISASRDNTLKLWHIASGRCLATFEGHTDSVWSVAVLPDGERAISGSSDGSLRLWEINTGAGAILAQHMRSFLSVAVSLDGATIIAGLGGDVIAYRLVGLMPAETVAVEQRTRYTNAKVVMVGESGVGKSGLGYRLAENRWVVTDSTHGMRVWPLELPPTADRPDIERELCLWDLAGQPEYRLIHQLFLNETSLALVLFDPSNPDDPFKGIGHWVKALHTAAGRDTRKLLVAGRVNRGGATVTQGKIDGFVAEHGFSKYYATSAETGQGCDELRNDIVAHVPWDELEWISTPKSFKAAKEAILNLRSEDIVLLRFSDLWQRLQSAMPTVHESERDVRAVVALLAGQGIVRQLDFGDFILLQPELLNNYASAVVRAARKHVDGIGSIAENKVLEGSFDFEGMPRLPRADEEILLRALVQTFLGQSLCIREAGQLVFPSQFNREIPEIPAQPNVIVTYRFSGPLESIYTTLVVRLHYSESFEMKDLWKNAAEFYTEERKRVGFVMDSTGDGSGKIRVFFDAGVPDDTRVTFIKYIHKHLLTYAIEVTREREYICAHCSRLVKDRDAVEYHLELKHKHIPCAYCGKKVLLIDLIERKFSEEQFSAKVLELDRQSSTMAHNLSMEQALIGHMFAVAAQAPYVYRPVSMFDFGIDGEVEFFNDAGRPSGRKVYVQLKSGDYYTYERQRDGEEVFTVTNEAHIEYWQTQPCDVYLVIRTTDRIRWMNVTEYLKRREDKESRQIIFRGEVLNADAVRRLRERILAQRH